MNNWNSKLLKFNLIKQSNIKYKTQTQQWVKMAHSNGVSAHGHKSKQTPQH